MIPKLLLVLCFTAVVVSDPEFACDSPVYCNNEMLSTIQLAHLFNDSKTFVDMPLSVPVEEVLLAFEELPTNPDNATLVNFLQNYFLEAGSDLEEWIPSDWQSEPKQLIKIRSQSLQQWALSLNELWKQLGKQLNSSVYANPERHSLYPVPNPFIVPGGRFREFYYWDTYWIVNGLLACGMLETTQLTIENFYYFIDTLSYIPNGARVYYKERSQPPLFTQIIESYYQLLLKQSDTTNAVMLLQNSVSRLEKEYNYWMQNKSITISKNGINYILNQYKANSNFPRPEGYADDVQTGIDAGLSDPEASNILYQNIATAAESGWDFSTRFILTLALFSYFFSRTISENNN